MDILEEQSREERDSNLKVEEDTRLSNDRGNHWNNMVEENIK